MNRKPCLDSSLLEYGISRHLSSNQQDKMEACGKVMFACACLDCQTIKYLPSHCKLRWCPTCYNKIQRRRIAQMVIHFSEFRDIKFLTLTQKPYSNLKESISDIKKAFERFKRHKKISKILQSGFYQIETKARTEGTWHTHIHIICAGLYVPHRILVTAWQQALKQKKPPSVRVNQIQNNGKLYRYVTKYISKPVDFLNFTDSQAQELLSLSKVKLWGSFGKVASLPKDELRCDCGGFYEPWFIYRKYYGQNVLDCVFGSVELVVDTRAAELGEDWLFPDNFN